MTETALSPGATVLAKLELVPGIVDPKTLSHTSSTGLCRSMGQFRRSARQSFPTKFASGWFLETDSRYGRLWTDSLRPATDFGQAARVTRALTSAATDRAQMGIGKERQAMPGQHSNALWQTIAGEF